MKKLSAFGAGIVLAASVVLSGPAAAYVFSIDNFEITKNGSQLFNDTFGDGVPPPSAPNFSSGTPTSYSTRGVFGETGGRATMNLLDAAILPSGLTGNLNYRHRARLLTNTGDATDPRGLKTDDTFVVEALFDLVVPSPAGDFYYLRLTDSTGSATDNDILEVRVRIGNSGNPIVQFREIDDALDVSTVLATDGVPTTGGAADHDQIMLRLAKNDALSNVITASYEYFDAGVGQGNASFSGPGDVNTSSNIFRGEEWTRAEFGAVQPVPEPASLALLGLGLAGLGYARRKRAD